MKIFFFSIVFVFATFCLHAQGNKNGQNNQPNNSELTLPSGGVGADNDKTPQPTPWEKMENYKTCLDLCASRFSNADQKDQKTRCMDACNIHLQRKSSPEKKAPVPNGNTDKKKN